MLSWFDFQARTVVITRIFEISERQDEFVDVDAETDGKQSRPSKNKNKNTAEETQRMSSSGLVPFADMLNHSEEKNTIWAFEPERNEFVIRAKGVVCCHFLFCWYSSLFA